MPAIVTGSVQEVIKQLKSNAYIMNLLPKDSQGVYSIRPELFIPSGSIFPQITIAWDNGKSNSIIPACEDTLRLCLWLQTEYKEPYRILDEVEDQFLSIFNRKGIQLSNIDIPTDTGIRFCQFVKMSTDKRFDDKERKFYCETIFKVNLSEGESFNPANSSNQPWV